MSPVDADAQERAKSDAERRDADDVAWARYDQTAQQVRAFWPVGYTTEALLDEVRG